ncbi:teichoic acid transport system ATP-binding protein [Georgenia satyanarayanai]|uniref:Teichoic acid transport system ATP-binding protein n=1 Tax=Georgenia satyanarayanai TaxID=860221 RepID=A0A2Y9AG74_9MICO|nr:ABC transporter ATP-binding protein [Georgenia satyanarayanai]PYF99393.1 teichoic acid transport system ATP-binding protein [Georgenia satyanarayanai]SSA43205.1 teichoic acid transport system ATP-binding protein [Georgenia satyanarayanai]
MAVTDERVPSLISSHVDVIYRVYGAKKMGTVSGAPGNASLKRLLKGRGSIGGVREVHAVKDVSFVAYHGESIGIVGRNGSGKSTLLRALAGLIPPTNGEIYTAGTPALLGVNAVLMRELSGERNVMIGGQALGLTPKQVREKMDDIVSFAGVEDYIDLPMKAYSSGMAARLRFAISTAAVPDILMIDEALATGDAEFQARSRERVAEIREAAGTVFLVSHSDSTVRAMCDRALWLDKGRLVMDGPANEVCDAYQAARSKTSPKKAGAKKPAPKAPATKTPAGASAPAAEKSAATKPAPADKPASAENPSPAENPAPAEKPAPDAGTTSAEDAPR